MIENSDPSKGGLVHTNMPFRLKHISSGFYLSIAEDKPFLSENPIYESL